MDHVLIDTSAGKIGLAGRLHAAPPRPSLLMVSGAFPEKGKHHELVGWFPDANVLIANLPGMGGVPWSDADASQLTAGLAETIQLMFREQPLVVCGCSASSLVTIPLTSANIHRKIILEPFLTTQGLWPFVNYSRDLLRRNPDSKHLRSYLWSMFGYSETEVENRDYRHVLDLNDIPTDVVVGGLALLPARPLPRFPSLTSVEDRAILAAHPKVSFYEGPAEAGHDLWSNPQASALARGLMARSLRSAAELL